MANNGRRFPCGDDEARSSRASCSCASLLHRADFSAQLPIVGRRRYTRLNQAYRQCGTGAMAADCLQSKWPDRLSEATCSANVMAPIVVQFSPVAYRMLAVGYTKSRHWYLPCRGGHRRVPCRINEAWLPGGKVDG